MVTRFVSRNLGLKCLAISLILFSTAETNSVHAAARRGAPRAGTVVDPASVTQVTVEIGAGKKKTQVISCVNSVPGFVKPSKGAQKFTSYAQQLKTLKKQSASAAQIGLARTLAKLGKTACKESSVPSTPMNPNPEQPPSNTPALSLARYTGPFTENEARILFGRFAFGASEARIQEAVADGLDTTITKLTTYQSDDALTGAILDIECDTYLAGDKNNNPTACTANNMNSFSRDGMRLGLNYRILNSPNRYFNKLLTFLHDERLATGSSAARDEEKYAVRDHMGLLLRAAASGDYMQYMRDWNDDLLGHLRWLDGASNKGTSPNENYAREFWELGTVGPTDLDGNPVYTDVDLAQSALAFSGWTLVRVEERDGLGAVYNRIVKAFSTALHAPGVFTIFAGTPYAAQVTNQEEVLQATFRHPRVAEHLAEDIWKEFVNPFPTKEKIRELAQLIRDNNYKLHPVMRKVMGSNAVYAAESRKSLVKHPMDLMFGFMAQFPEFKVPHWNTPLHGFDYNMSRLGQRLLSPPTVFGWDEKRLAGEAFVLDWRNVAVEMLGQWNFNKDYQYDVKAQMVNGVTSSLDAIQKYAKRLNVELTNEQVAQLDQFMNFQYRVCKDWRLNEDECKGGAPFYLEREAFDASPLNKNAWTSDYKVLGVIAALMMMPDYRMK